MAEISNALSKGDIIVYPTETLYGIGGDPFAPGNPMKRIAHLKHRPLDQPFIFLIPDIRFLEENGIPLSPGVRKLTERFWPGPLTIILNVPLSSPLAPIAHEGSIAVRVSPHPFAQTLFRHRRFPLISTSANLSGASEEQARDPETIAKTFKNEINLLITEGPLKASPPSTLLDARSSPPRLIREGAIPFRDISSLL